MDDRDDLFEAYLDGTLDATGKQRLERLLETRENRSAFVERLRLEGELRLLRAQSVEPALAQPAPRPAIPGPWRRSMVAAGVAAAAATALAAIGQGALPVASTNDGLSPRTARLVDAPSATHAVTSEPVTREVCVSVIRSGERAAVASCLRPGDAIASIDGTMVHHYADLRREAEYSIRLLPIQRATQGRDQP